MYVEVTVGVVKCAPDWAQWLRTCVISKEVTSSISVGGRAVQIDPS